LRGAVSFLTRLPVRGRGDVERAKAVLWFPVVGAGIGIGIASMYVGFSLILPRTIAAILAAAGGAFLTGALHEDGLADVADAFGGGLTTERRLEILRDPRLGTYGVLAIMVAVLVRVGSIASMNPWSAAVLLPVAHSLSRGTAAVLMHRSPPARSSGLGATYGAASTRRGASWTVGIALAIAAAAIGVWAIPAVLLCIATAVGFGVMAHRKIGGITGDVLGATQQVSELAILLLGAAVVHQRWGALAWWLA
jgi:adenosylcobinamide-GDP ribazoletransferase